MRFPSVSLSSTLQTSSANTKNDQHCAAGSTRVLWCNSVCDRVVCLVLREGRSLLVVQCGVLCRRLHSALSELLLCQCTGRGVGNIALCHLFGQLVRTISGISTKFAYIRTVDNATQMAHHDGRWTHRTQLEGILCHCQNGLLPVCSGAAGEDQGIELYSREQLCEICITIKVFLQF